MLSNAVLDAMVAAGCSAEQITAAVKASNAEAEAALAAKRAKAAGRKRRQREREASHSASIDVTRNERDTVGQPLSSGSSSPTPLSSPNLTLDPPIVPPREKFASPEVVLQRAIDPLNAKRFCDHCASKGKRLSPQTAEMIADVLLRIRAGGGSSIAAVDYAIKRGWTTIDEDWLRDSGAKAVAVPPRAEDWSDRVEAFREDGTWIPAWGPKPGEKDCRAPPELQRSAAA